MVYVEVRRHLELVPNSPEEIAWPNSAWVLQCRNTEDVRICCLLVNVADSWKITYYWVVWLYWEELFRRLPRVVWIPWLLDVSPLVPRTLLSTPISRSALSFQGSRAPAKQPQQLVASDQFTSLLSMGAWQNLVNFTVKLPLILRYLLNPGYPPSRGPSSLVLVLYQHTST